VNVHPARKIVVLGMMSKMPVAGVIWQTLHYLIGFRRLGYDVYYVETHGIKPWWTFFKGEGDDGWTRASAFVDGVMRRFDLTGRWAIDTVHGDARCVGMSRGALRDLYREAELIVNLHGGTEPRPEHSETGRLIYLETDPVEVQIELYHHKPEAIAYLEPHRALFTFGENYGRPDCSLPVSDRFRFRPTRQPVVLDFWRSDGQPAGPAFTTIGNWRQPYREVHFQGEVYHWSKHYEFLKFLDLPRHTAQPFELALSRYGEDDKSLLESKGWRVRHALDLSTEMAPYRDYITGSRGEFTVAKDQNVRLRSGWFSDRSATYLAAGRPVVTQETGFSNILPTGAGLFAFSTLEEAAEAVERINKDYTYHCRAAAAVARDYFDSDRVLGDLLYDLGF
jgi:hypothetical protein